METRPARETVLDESGLESLIADLSARIAPAIAAAPHPALVGIRTRGLTLARRLYPMLRSHVEGELPFGSLDITLYRDDLSTLGAQPIVGRTELPFAIDGATVFLVDDVLFTGRTARAAIDALLAYGRPAAIRLAVLVDRGHREYPIHADQVGRTITTTLDQIVKVHLSEVDGEDGIDIVST